MTGTIYASAENAMNIEIAQSEYIDETAAAQERIYCIASVSKMYSTLAVMQLVDEGKVELDAPITEYLPDFRMDDERYRIGTEMSGKSIAVTRPENSAIFVYNKFRELVYSTHVKDVADTIDLPTDGYIVFIGETEDSVKIFG